MITRKHYNAIAEIIKDASWLVNKGPHTAKDVGVDPYDLIHNLADYFLEDNPNFNYDKWLEACTPEEVEADQ